VIYSAKAEPNCVAVVFGLGGIGLNVIQGLKMIGAKQIVGVDLNPEREAIARKFGMTDFVNPTKIKGDLTGHIVDVTGGGADYTFVVDMYMDGRIQIDPLITHKMGIEDINKAFDLMHKGESIRSVVEF